MLFGQGTTGLLVALVVSLSSGAAFMICFREIVREMFSARSFDQTLRRNRNILLDEKNGAFMVDDSVFERLLESRANDLVWAKEGVESRSTYLCTLGFLGFVAIAGFVAGVSHFA